MNRRTVALLIGLLASGFLLLGASQYSFLRITPLMDGAVSVPDNVAYLSFQGHYDVYGGSGQTLKGDLKSSDPNISFFVFTYDGFNNWISSGLQATNASGAPFASVNASSMASSDVSLASFSHSLPPTGGYFLVFFNGDSSRWNTSSSSTSQVMARIDIVSRVTPYSWAFWPSLALLGLGAITLIGFLLGVSSESILRPLRSDERVLAAFVLAILIGVSALLVTLPPFGFEDCNGGGCLAPYVRVDSVRCSSSQGVCSFVLRNLLPAAYPYNDVYTEGSATMSSGGQTLALECPVVPITGGGINFTLVCKLQGKALSAGVSFAGRVSISGSPTFGAFAGDFAP